MDQREKNSVGTDRTVWSQIGHAWTQRYAIDEKIDAQHCYHNSFMIKVPFARQLANYLVSMIQAQNRYCCLVDKTCVGLASWDCLDEIRMRH